MSEEKKNKVFEGLNVSSKFAICGLPIRVDTYKTCSFGCKYCFSNNRKIMEFEKEFGITVPDEDTQLIATVGDAIAYIEEHLA